MFILLFAVMTEVFSRDLIAAAISVSLKALDFRTLRHGQEKAVREFVRGNDVFVSLPTGSGKSLCYWILPLIYNYLRKKADSMVIVVSPLVALMQDQTSILEKKGIKAVLVSSATDSVAEEIKQGKYAVLFFSPECLLTELDWRDVLQSAIFQEQLVGFIIDEAHCVKNW